MLGDRNACACDNKGSASGDIVRALGVAARAAGIDCTFRRAHWDRSRPEGESGAGDFLHGLASDAHAHEQGANLRVGRRTRHDQVEGLGRFGLSQALP